MDISAQKKMLNAINLRGMHIKATMRYHFTPNRMAEIKKTEHWMLAAVWNS